MNRPFSTREKVLLVVLVVLVMCICYFKLLLEPINDSIADYQMKASAEQDEIVANTALLTKMNNMKKELRKLMPPGTRFPCRNTTITPPCSRS